MNTERIELVEAHNIAKAIKRVDKANRDWRRVVYMALLLADSPAHGSDRQKYRDAAGLP